MALADSLLGVGMGMNTLAESCLSFCPLRGFIFKKDSPLFPLRQPGKRLLSVLIVPARRRTLTRPGQAAAAAERPPQALGAHETKGDSRCPIFRQL